MTDYNHIHDEHCKEIGSVMLDYYYGFEDESGIERDMLDWLEDIYTWEIRRDDNGNYKSCRLCWAWGGPWGYLDTESRTITYGDHEGRGTYTMTGEMVHAINEYVEEIDAC